jgi:hypothetical protein
VPMLAKLIVSETAESLGLSNRIVIEVHTASFRAVCGYTIVCALLDELAFWPTDEGSADPDTEVITAIRPGMALERQWSVRRLPYHRTGLGAPSPMARRSWPTSTTVALNR